MCSSGLVSGGPPTHWIIAVAFYLLLFVAPLASTLRTKLVEDMVRCKHSENLKVLLDLWWDQALND